MPRALIALGANVGDRRQTIARAVELLVRAAARGEPRVSACHQTAPVGGPPGQEPFLNAALTFETDVDPRALHALLKQTELQLGRTPGERWSARVLDLDLLLYDAEVIDEPQLQVPHPRMTFRHFVLAPAAEVAADLVHPLCGSTLGELLAKLPPPGYPVGCYVALLAPSGLGKTALANSVSAHLGGHFLPDPAATLHPAAPNDPTGPVFDRQIQFLDRAESWQADRLARLASQTSSGLVISDFYADQGLAYAACELDVQDWPRWQSLWASRQANVVAPHLLVVLDTWSAAVAVWRGEMPGADQPFLHGRALRSEMLRLALRKHGPPVLFAGSTDRQRQQDEIQAAIEAMRS